MNYELVAIWSSIHGGYPNKLTVYLYGKSYEQRDDFEVRTPISGTTHMYIIIDV